MIEARDIVFDYPGNRVLENITVRFGEAQFTTILGPNGAGKSTLIKILAGIMANYQGVVRYQGTNIKDLSRRELAKIAAYIPQEVHLSFPFSVKEIVQMGRHPYQPFFGGDSEKDASAVEAALETIGCENLKDRIFYELSGGEKQLVLVASALAQEPSVLLLDEPAAALDIYHQIRIYHILRQLAREKNLIVIVITHQINQALNNADRIILLDQGKISMDATPGEVIESDILKSVFHVKGENIFQDKRKRWYFIAQDIAD